MVGLAGILKMEKSTVDISDLLMRMCQVLKHESWLKVNLFAKKNVGLGRIYLGITNPESQPIFNEDNSILIMMDGEIFGYQNTKNELISKGHKFSVNNDPEFVLHCYEEYGHDVVNFLNGTFIIALWDKNKGKLLLINDRYGARPLYYTINNGYLLFSSEVKAILEDKTFERIVNNKAVFDFFRWGHLLGNKTYFQGINLLPPASFLEYERNNLKIKQYCRMKFTEVYEDYPEDYYISKLERLILQAVKRQTDKNHKLGVFLSGGLDSRTIAASLHKNDKDFKFNTLTFGKNPYCDDARYALAISKKLGVPHHFFTLPQDYLGIHTEKIVYMTDGMVPCFDIHAISIFGLMRRYCEIGMIGTLMDMMFSDLTRNFLNIGRRNAIYKMYNETNNNFDKEKIKKLFAADYFNQNGDLAWTSLKDAIREIRCKLSSNFFSHFRITERTRRFTNRCTEVDRNYFECRTPFLDNDLVDFFLTIPPNFRVEELLYSKTLGKLSPDLVKIPWQMRGFSVRACRFQIILHRIGRYILALLFRLISIISFNRIKLCNFRKELHDYDEWIRKNELVKKYYLSILLDDKTLSRKYFNPNYIKKLLQLHMSGKENYSRQLTSLLTFELWHREFIDDKR